MDLYDEFAAVVDAQDDAIDDRGESRRQAVDMTPEAIDRRLRQVASLYRLGISIAQARREPPAPCLPRQTGT